MKPSYFSCGFCDLACFFRSVLQFRKLLSPKLHISMAQKIDVKKPDIAYDCILSKCVVILPCFNCKLGHRAGRIWTGDKAWVISFQWAQVTSYYPEDSPRPLLSHDRFPTVTFSHDAAVHVISRQRRGVSATCCEAKFCSRAGKCVHTH